MPGVACAIEERQLGVDVVFQVDREEVLEAVACPFQDRAPAAVLAPACRHAQVEIVVENELRDLAGVLVDQPAGACEDVDLIEIVPAGVPIIEPDGNERGIALVRPLPTKGHVAIGRQITRLGAVDGDAPQVEVLIAAGVPAVENVSAGAGEPVKVDRPLGLPR